MYRDRAASQVALHSGRQVEVIERRHVLNRRVRGHRLVTAGIAMVARGAEGPVDKSGVGVDADTAIGCRFAQAAVHAVRDAAAASDLTDHLQALLDVLGRPKLSMGQVTELAHPLKVQVE